MEGGYLPSGSGSGAGPKHFDPTPEGWRAFRQAIRDQDALSPVMGTAQYHYRAPGPPRITRVFLTDKEIAVDLKDGRRVVAPLDWFPILRDASHDERERFVIESGGTWIRFPLLNTEVTVEHLLVCRGGFDETGFLLMCASPEKLEPDAAALIRRLAEERGVTDNEALEMVRRHLKRWPEKERDRG